MQTDQSQQAGRNVNQLSIPLIVLAVLFVTGCGPNNETMNRSDLVDFATRYAAAWSSQNPVELASFYAEHGSLVVNDGEPSVGRDAIAATAGSFMEAFPDMVVRLDSIVTTDDNHAIFHWRWTGTYTGPGGNGKSVDITGYEEWTLDSGNLIEQSLGHYDQSEYERQVRAD